MKTAATTSGARSAVDFGGSGPYDASLEAFILQNVSDVSVRKPELLDTAVFDWCLRLVPFKGPCRTLCRAVGGSSRELLRALMPLVRSVRKSPYLCVLMSA